jgi:hypothetical protein
MLMADLQNDFIYHNIYYATNECPEIALPAPASTPSRGLLRLPLHSSEALP